MKRSATNPMQPRGGTKAGILQHCRCGFASALALVALLYTRAPTFAAASLQILDIRLDSQGHARIRHTADANSYYLLYRGDTVTSINLGIDAALGQSSEGVLSDLDLVATRSAAFYRVRQVPLTQPLDSDADGIDDVYELRHRPFLNPLDPTDAARDADGDGLTNAQEYRNATRLEDAFAGNWVSIGPTHIPDGLGAIGRLGPSPSIHFTHRPSTLERERAAFGRRPMAASPGPPSPIKTCRPSRSLRLR